MTVSTTSVPGLTAGFDALSVINSMINAVNHYIDVHETEMTKRAAIAAREHAVIEEIHARRDLFLTYLDRSFDERARTFKELFRALDHALTGADAAAIASVLGSITALSAKSPFADLHDIELVKQNLADPDHEWTA